MSAIRVCALEELADPGSRGFDEYGIFLVRRGDQLFAYQNRCPHRGVGLEWVADQFLDAEQRLIQCATHGALFRLETGDCIAGPCQGQRLTPVPLWVEEGQVWVELDQPF